MSVSTGIHAAASAPLAGCTQLKGRLGRLSRELHEQRATLTTLEANRKKLGATHVATETALLDASDDVNELVLRFIAAQLEVQQAIEMREDVKANTRAKRHQLAQIENKKRAINGRADTLKAVHTKQLNDLAELQCQVDKHFETGQRARREQEEATLELRRTMDHAAEQQNELSSLAANYRLVSDAVKSTVSACCTTQPCDEA